MRKAIALLFALGTLGGSALAQNQNGWVYWPGTGTYYKVVSRPAGISWTEAKDEAAAQGAYLATITSLWENYFVFSLLQDSSLWDLQENTGVYFGPWLGMYQVPGSQEPAGGWRCQTPEPLNYFNWNPGEPNNGSGLGEDKISYAYSGVPKPTWNDLPDAGFFPGDQAHVISYVMEAWRIKDTLAPAAYTVANGLEESGGLSALANIDQVYDQIQQQSPQNGLSPVTVLFQTTSATNAPSSLTLYVRNRVSRTGLAQAIDLYNWQTGLWDTMSVRLASLTDATVAASPVDPLPYVHPTTRLTQGRLRVYVTNGVNNTWRAFIDKAHWVIWK